MAHKTFGKPRGDDAVAAEPITFDLAGEEGLACRKSVNGKLLIELVGKVESGRVSEQTSGILSVFAICLLTNDGENPDAYTGKDPERHSPKEIEAAAEDEIEVGVDPTSSLGRLRTVLDDPDTEIEIDELAELVGWLVEQYTSRPTQKPGSSSGGRASTSRSSRRAARRPGGTSAPLESVPSST
jgi:hypothetical protein